MEFHFKPQQAVELYLPLVSGAQIAIISVKYDSYKEKEKNFLIPILSD